MQFAPQYTSTILQNIYTYYSGSGNSLNISTYVCIFYGLVFLKLHWIEKKIIVQIYVNLKQTKYAVVIIFRVIKIFECMEAIKCLKKDI